MKLCNATIYPPGGPIKEEKKEEKKKKNVLLPHLNPTLVPKVTFEKISRRIIMDLFKSWFNSLDMFLYKGCQF